MRYPIPTSLVLAAMLASCGQVPAANDQGADPGNAASPANAAAPAPAPAADAAASKTEEKTEDFSFAYSYPAKAAAISPLATLLDEDRTKTRASVASEAAKFRTEAAKEGFPFRPHESTTEWKVVTDTPRLLSLSSTNYSYIGGAHGMTGFEGLVWDKSGNRRVAATDMFTSPAALQKVAGKSYCDAIDVERQKRRGTPVVRSDDMFNDCPEVSKSTLILGSTDGARIDRLGFLIEPYVAGPYAEGDFEVTLPVTADLLAIVKPEWKEAFAAR